MTIDKKISLSDVAKTILWVVLFVYAAGARSQEVKDVVSNNVKLTVAVETLTKELQAVKIEITELRTTLKFVEMKRK